MYWTKKLALHKVTIVTGILTLYGLCHYTAVRQRVFMTPLEKPMSPMTCYQCTVSSRPDNIQTTHFTLTTMDQLVVQYFYFAIGKTTCFWERLILLYSCLKCCLTVDLLVKQTNSSVFFVILNILIVYIYSFI